MSTKPLKCPAIVGVWFCLILLVPWRSLGAADLPPASSRLPRTNLLVFHNRAGVVVPVKSKADWQQRHKDFWDKYNFYS